MHIYMQDDPESKRLTLWHINCCWRRRSQISQLRRRHRYRLNRQQQMQQQSLCLIGGLSNHSVAVQMPWNLQSTWTLLMKQKFMSFLICSLVKKFCMFKRVHFAFRSILNLDSSYPVSKVILICLIKIWKLILGHRYINN